MAVSPAIQVGEVLNNTEKSLAERFRALFTLRGLGGQEAIDQISKCLLKDSSVLLKHECAYCLGQMTDPRSSTILQSVLGDLTEDPMVRHEAGEALGAIGKMSALPVLEQYLNDPSPEVAETCQIARDRLNWLADKESDNFIDNNPYLSVDPAPPTYQGDLSQWEQQLHDHTLSLFKRYRALFALRNIGGTKAVEALTTGFQDNSALFKHEIAYVLGQMKHSAAISALLERLKDTQENPMVRHECAEALGSIATEECLTILQEFSSDEERVVRESCLVALDMYKYEHSQSFQYADTLSIINS